MSSPPVVVVFHGGRRPPAEAMEPVAERAQLRFARAEDLPEALPGAQVIYAYDFLSTAVRDTWHAAGSVEWLHVAAAGVDPFLSPEVRGSDVIITNSRGVFDGGIAEYVLGQVLSFAKDFPGSLRRQQQHVWEHRETERVAGTRALVVGTGPIGRQIARLLTAAGVEARGSGRRAIDDDPDFGTVTPAERLHEALAEADWVVLAAPLTEQTRGMIDAAALRAMRPTARLINVGRGELVRTDELVTALRGGTIAAAALDVVSPEPPEADHPLWELENVSLTPHHSGDVAGWRTALTELFAENFVRWSEGQPLRNVVDKTLGYVPGS